MYACPHCKNSSITFGTILKYPFSRVLECPVCHSQVRYKRKISNYAVAIYLASVLISSRFFDTNIGLDTAFGVVLALTAFLMQITFASFEETGGGPSIGDPE